MPVHGRCEGRSGSGYLNDNQRILGEEFSGCRPRRTAVRIRYGRDLGSDSCLAASIWALRHRQGHDCFHSSGRHNPGSDVRWHPGILPTRAVETALVGTILGAMFAGIPGDRYGRRGSLRITAVLYLLSALGCAFAFGWYSLVVARFIGGLGIGASSVLGPMYIAEIAPPKQRGRPVGAFQFNIVFGILLAYFSNYVIGTFGFGDLEWRWKLGVSGIPAALFLVMLFAIPRSEERRVGKE